MRKKPAHCSKVFGPMPRPYGSRRDHRNAPCCSRCATIFARVAGAESGHARQQRCRGKIHVNANRVHAVLDYRIELLRQQRLVHVVLILDPHRWTSDRSSPALASGSCKRRAMLTAPRKLTSRSGNLCDAYSLAGTPRRRLALTTTLVTPAPSFLQSDPLRVHRFAACGAVANRDQLHAMRLVHSLRRACSEPSQSLRGSCGITPCWCDHLAGGVHHATFTPVRIPGSSPSPPCCPAVPRQQITHVVAEHL